MSFLSLNQQLQSTERNTNHWPFPDPLWDSWEKRRCFPYRGFVMVHTSPTGGLCGFKVERSWSIRSRVWISKQYNSVPADGRWRSSARKATAGLVESNGSLPPGGRLQVTCRLTACTPGSAPSPMLGNEYGRTLPFTLHNSNYSNME